MEKKPAILEPCASCGVRCCNRFAVPITGFDAARVCKHTGLKAGEFAQLADSKNIEDSVHSKVFIFKDGKLEERLLTLIRKKNMYCIFSRHSKGCGIWGAHPMVCKSYPFAYDEKEGIKYTKNFVCPRKWRDDEYVKEVVKKVVQRMEFEIVEYNKIIRKWNATEAKDAKNEKEFWKYLIRESILVMKKWGI